MASETELLLRVKVELTDAIRQLEKVNAETKKLESSARESAGGFKALEAESKQAVAQLDRTSVSINRVQSSAQASTGGFKNMQRGVQNTSYQLQDFIVQVTGGQDAFRAFGQQAPQMLMGFGAMGAAIGVVAALVPVAVDAFKSLTKGSLTVEESIKATSKALELLGESTKLPDRAKMDGFITQFKEADASTRAWLISSLDLKIALASLNTIDLRGGIGQQLKDIIASLSVTERMAATQTAYAKKRAETYNPNAGSLSDGADPSAGVVVSDADIVAAAMGAGTAKVYQDLQAARDFVLTTAQGSAERTAALAKEATLLASAAKTITEFYEVSGKPVPESVKKGLEDQVRLNAQMLQLNKDVAETEAAKNRALLGNFTTTSDIKKGAAQAQADFENFNKIKRDNIVATQQLAEENTRLNRTEFDVEASIYKTSEARKKSIELEQLHKAQKSRLTDEQYDYIQSQYKEQEAIDKSNQGRAAALQMLEKSVTAQEKYNREMAKAGLLFINTRFSAEEYKKVVDGIAEEYARQSQMISGVTTAIGNSFSDAILNGKSLTDVMAGLARTIAEVTLKTQVVLPLVKALNQFLGNLFMPKDPFNQPGPYGGTNAGGWTASANGNVFDTPISLGASNVLPFARGGVVTNPKFFPMATGRGLMGESGPEAVMPLRRGPDGKLGVSAATSGGGTQVNVYNQNGGQVETKQRSSLDGGKVIDIYIKKAVAEGISSGQFDKAMGSTYGLRRQGAR